jgi:hypothetical protein
MASPILQRSQQPELKENEASLRQVLWNHFESEFNVECDGILLKPEVFKHKIFRKTSSPIGFFKKIAPIIFSEFRHSLFIAKSPLIFAVAYI